MSASNLLTYTRGNPDNNQTDSNSSTNSDEQRGLFVPVWLFKSLIKRVLGTGVAVPSCTMSIM